MAIAMVYFGFIVYSLSILQQPGSDVNEGILVGVE